MLVKKIPAYFLFEKMFFSVLKLKKCDMILFLHKQGSGKTSLARKLARAWKCELINGE